ncbi:MAG: 4-hydroxy-3-methylbut-2-enyl diphosphate reductase [Lachnospiraceae bacterium]
MKIRMASTAGFCFGVKRAVDKAYALAESSSKKLYTIGPLIHNEEVVSDLMKRGVYPLSSREELEALTDAIVLIRSHGVGKPTYELLEALGLEVVDLTCPYVLKIHRAVEKDSEAGRQIIIIGDAAHPEVIGISEWCQTPPIIINNRESAQKVDINPKVGCTIVVQTTFNHKNFKELVDILAKKGYDSTVLNTICNATHERQCEAKKIASKVDTMIVVGGKNSSNTQKLFEICKNQCSNTYHIQTHNDISSDMFQSSSCIGITAGASTPNKIIEEVQTHVRTEL